MTRRAGRRSVQILDLLRLGKISLTIHIMDVRILLPRK